MPFAEVMPMRTRTYISQTATEYQALPARSRWWRYPGPLQGDHNPCQEYEKWKPVGRGAHDFRQPQRVDRPVPGEVRFRAVGEASRRFTTHVAPFFAHRSRARRRRTPNNRPGRTTYPRRGLEAILFGSVKAATQRSRSRIIDT